MIMLTPVVRAFQGRPFDLADPHRSNGYRGKGDAGLQDWRVYADDRN